MKQKVRWWPWFITVTIIVFCGFYRGWDTISWILVSLVLCTGLVRAFYTWVGPAWCRKLARLSPEEREKYLHGMSADDRKKMEEKLKEYGA